MLAVDEVPLDQFYSEYLRHLECAGLKLLIMALVREADAPAFYSDVLRYWSSLHDLTGTQIAFAVAGPDQTREHQGIGTITSSLFAGKPSTLMQLDRWHLEQLAKRPRIDAQSLADANTKQISKLRDCLHLTEDRLPCLHLTLFLPRKRMTAAIELRSFPRFSVYTACKDILVTLGGALISVSRAESELVNQLQVLIAPLQAERAAIDDELARLLPPSITRTEKLISDLRTTVSSMWGCGRTSIPCPARNWTGPIWSKKMKGPTN